MRRDTQPINLAQLEKEKAELDAINEKQEKRVNESEKKIIKLANFYVVFQGVILTALSQAQKLRCNDWWIPFSLSLAASVTNFIALCHSIPKYLKTRQQLELIRSDLEEKRRSIEHIKGSISSSYAHNSSHSSGQHQRIDMVRFFWRKAYMTLLAVLIFGFGVVMLVSCRRILCHDSSPTA